MLLFLAEQAGSTWAEYTSLLKDPAHILFELTLEFITGVLVYPFAKKFWEKAVKRHDEQHHPHDKDH